jgi:colanic acid/amylovoran biosynthesis protein
VNIVQLSVPAVPRSTRSLMNASVSETSVDHSSERNILISNAFADDNRGGAAITGAAIEAVLSAFPDARVAAITVGSGTPDQSHRFTRARYPDVDILPPLVEVPDGPLGGLRAILRSIRFLLVAPGRSASPAIRRLLEADLVVSKGGYVFVDRQGLRGLLSLWLTAFPVILASQHGIPTAIHATTIGPFGHRSSRALNRWILRRATLVLPRDRRSYAEALSLGLNPRRVREVPDSVFGQTPPARSLCESAAEKLGFQGVRFGTVTVLRGSRSSEAHQQFLTNLASVVRGVLDRGIVDRIAVVVQVDGETSDADTSRSFVDSVADPRVRLVCEDLPPEDLIAFYGAGSFTVGCRLHSAIFSLVGGTPAFAIAVGGAKTYGVFESLGLQGFVVPYPYFDGQALGSMIEEVVGAGEASRRAIREVVATARVAASYIPDLLRPLIG